MARSPARPSSRFLHPRGRRESVRYAVIRAILVLISLSAVLFTIKYLAA